jgi:PTS system ascorbate-specific IIA component
MIDFSEKQFLHNVSVKDWEEAIIVAGNLLVDNGYAKPEYIDGMLKLAEELGPYIVITPGIAIPHARPEDGAEKVGYAVVKLDPPIDFGNPDNDPVHLVIGFCSPKADSHIDLLTSIARILEKNNLLERIIATKSRAELVDLFKGLST